MESLTRLVELLSAFDERATWPVNALLARLRIPTATGYKLIAALMSRELLCKPSRGCVALGPAAADFFFVPLRALPSDTTDRRTAGGALRERGPAVSRVAQWNNQLLDLISTAPYQRDPPFVIGFANASWANPWRVAMADSLIAAAQRQHDVSRVLLRDAKESPALQARQLYEMRDLGMQLCILSAAAHDEPELNAAVSELSREGMPIVGVDRLCGRPNDLVSFVTSSDIIIGRISALWLAEFLGGSGRVLMLGGREDASPCQLRLQAAQEVFSLHPGIEILAIEYTDWQAAHAQDFVRRMLESGQVPDGVWSDSGLQSVGSLQAFDDAGYKRGAIPPHTGGELNRMYRMALERRVPICAVDSPAAMGALSFQTALDVLAGRRVPRRVETNMEIVVSRGHETMSVRADVLAEDKVRWDRDDYFVHAAGWIPGGTRRRGGPLFA